MAERKERDEDSLTKGHVSAVSHHDAGLTIIFPWGRLDDHTCFRRRLAADVVDEPFDALITGGKMIGVYQILPNGFGVAASRDAQFDLVAVSFTGAGRRTSARLRVWFRRCPVGGIFCGVGGHLPVCTGRFCRIGVGGDPMIGEFRAIRVGGHPVETGRFCRRKVSGTWRAQFHSGGLQIGRDRLPSNAGFFLDPA